jgi:hypothetical protein
MVPDPCLLTRSERAQLERLMTEHGDRRAAQLLLVSLATLIKAVARCRLRPSTAQCLRSRIRELNTGELKWVPDATIKRTNAN